MHHLSVTWQSYESLDALEGYNLDNLGGSDSFKEGMRWSDYLAGYETEWHPYVEAVRLAIIEGQVWAGGDWHQYSLQGAPVVAGEHFMGCGYRSWGDLLAAVWSSELNRDFSYMDFYMDGRLPAVPFCWTLRDSPHFLLLAVWPCAITTAGASAMYCYVLLMGRWQAPRTIQRGTTFFGIYHDSFQPSLPLPPGFVPHHSREPRAGNQDL